MSRQAYGFSWDRKTPSFVVPLTRLDCRKQLRAVGTIDATMRIYEIDGDSSTNSQEDRARLLES